MPLSPCRLTSVPSSRLSFRSLREQRFYAAKHLHHTAFAKLASRSDMAATSEHKTHLRYADVGINLGDPVFRGQYHGKQSHPDDFQGVLDRAVAAGCNKLMITGSDLKESRHAVDIAMEHPGLCYATIGIHPCSASVFTQRSPKDILTDLRALVADSSGPCVAFGEFGLDYDRLFLCPKDTQLLAFSAQLELASELKLPLFLHSRAAAQDFAQLLKPHLPNLPRRGLVHSFTGTVEEMRELVDLGLDIGVNGCSLKTEENLAVVKEIPLERLQIETDGPWCEMRQSHASAKHLQGAPEMPKAVKKEKWAQGCMVKGRNEPCTIPLVAQVIASVKGLQIEDVAEAAWSNSIHMFGLEDSSQRQ